jgi:hypothetical protein
MLFGNETFFTDEVKRCSKAGGNSFVHVLLHSTNTNTVEGFWSLVKNGVRAVYHSVGKRYLQTYLSEYGFRYNRRFDMQPCLLAFCTRSKSGMWLCGIVRRRFPSHSDWRLGASDEHVVIGDGA